MLIHGDSKIATLDETFPFTEEIADKIRYTGLVAPQEPSGSFEKQYDVVVSAGGGATGEAILKAAIAAKPQTSLNDRKWVATLGPHSDDQVVSEIQQLAAAENVEVVPFLDNLVKHLSVADLSISQAGYNTAADVLVSGCRSVMCPYSGIRQNEQPQRAEKFQKLGLAQMVSEQELSTDTLVAAIKAALNMPKPDIQIETNGASRTAEILQQLVFKEEAG